MSAPDSVHISDLHIRQPQPRGHITITTDRPGMWPESITVACQGNHVEVLHRGSGPGAPGDTTWHIATARAVRDALTLILNWSDTERDR